MLQWLSRILAFGPNRPVDDINEALLRTSKHLLKASKDPDLLTRSSEMGDNKRGGRRISDQ
jgi:hypothetical protein